MDVPNEYKTAGLLNLIGGALNILFAGGVFISMIWFCVGIFWLVPLAMGAFQAFIGFSMYSGKPVGQGKMAAILGIVAGVCNVNPFAVGVSAFAMMQLGNAEVAGWLEQHGS